MEVLQLEKLRAEQEVAQAQRYIEVSVSVLRQLSAQALPIVRVDAKANAGCRVVPTTLNLGGQEEKTSGCGDDAATVASLSKLLPSKCIFVCSTMTQTGQVDPTRNDRDALIGSSYRPILSTKAFTEQPQIIESGRFLGTVFAFCRFRVTLTIEKRTSCCSQDGSIPG